MIPRIIGLLLAVLLLVDGCRALSRRLPVHVFFPLATITPTTITPEPSTGTPNPTTVVSSNPLHSSTPTPLSTITPQYLSLTEQATALLSWAQEGLVGELTSLNRLTQYDIELSIDVESRMILGQADIYYTNSEGIPLKEVAFRLFPQTPSYGGQMRVDKMLAGGRPIPKRLDLLNSALYVLLSQPLNPTESLLFQLTFSAQVPDGIDAGYGQFSFSEGILALPHVYPLIPVYDDEGWNVELAPPYGDAVYSDVALYRVEVKAPSDQVVAASGSILTRVEHIGGSATTTFVTGPVRDFAVVMSADFVTSTNRVDGTQVTSYYVPSHAEAGQQALEYASNALKVFNENFGQYPYTELDVVETPTTAGGIEYPGLVVIGQSLYSESGDFFEFATVHETAHQWWYGLVGNDQVDEPWLDEALTQYSTLLYYEQVRDSSTADAIRSHYFERHYDELIQENRDAPIGQPVRAYSREDYGPVVYGKGPLFFHALRAEVGNEMFFTVLRAYFRAYRYKVATAEEFLDLAEEVSGRDLDSLYRKWILDTSE